MEKSEGETETLQITQERIYGRWRKCVPREHIRGAERKLPDMGNTSGNQMEGIDLVKIGEDISEFVRPMNFEVPDGWGNCTGCGWEDVNGAFVVAWKDVELWEEMVAAG
jgi:hypothetical protein